MTSLGWLGLDARTGALVRASRLAIAAQIEAAGKRDDGLLRFTADEPACPDVLRLAALGEEFGEVSQALHDDHPDMLRVELAQLAGVALAWMVALDVTA